MLLYHSDDNTDSMMISFEKGCIKSPIIKIFSLTGVSDICYK